jgi:hypothetical protein
MKKILGTLSSVTGILLNVVTAFAALIYLFGVVIWMHAPIGYALLLTLAMTLPFFGLAWILRWLGRSLSNAREHNPGIPPEDKE